MKNPGTLDVYTGGDRNFVQPRIRVGGVRVLKSWYLRSEARTKPNFLPNSRSTRTDR